MFEARRRVRLGDSSPGGRLRLDACARYLQDIANDDSREAGSPNPTAWVARRTVIRVDRFPEYLDMTTLWTWCSGLGPRWAERRYSVVADPPGAGRIEAATLWVHIDMATMKPIPVPEGFAEQFATAANGRTVKARLHLPTRPGDPADIARPDRTAAWPLRFTDFDILGHVNNAVYWSMVEEEVAARRERGRSAAGPLIVTLEHHDGIDRADAVILTVRDTALGFDLWVTTETGKVAAVVRAEGLSGGAASD
ncbi:MAG: hypothetical protein JWL72_2770 [Ilumatobacteraceae bacterium]|nr:hypothetical protein [Ilumatobacteraceae bacterium]MCU1389432.1 hypothetical protein [Ilumatobacteraceae bacterium]